MGQGEAQLGKYQSSTEVTRTFCKVCGSTMQYVAKQTFQDAFGLALGTVDGDPGCKPIRHVMVDSKAPWFEITDPLPQLEEAAPNGVVAHLLTNQFNELLSSYRTIKNKNFKKTSSS